MNSIPAAGPVRGIVRHGRGTGEHRVRPAPPELRPWVEHVWSVDWDLDRPVRNRVISFPAVHLTVEWGTDGTRHGHPLPATLVHGVVSRVFEIDLAERGGVVGVRFAPDGFAAWSGWDVSRLTDAVRPAVDVLGADYADLHTTVANGLDPEARADRLLAALARRRPAGRAVRSPRAELVDRMADDETLTRVDQLDDLAGVSSRTLQRRFRHDIGVSPKWVLTRFRLQHAALALEQDPDTDLARLAVRLGWYDQAHFTGDFRRMLGETPGEYAAHVRGTES